MRLRLRPLLRKAFAIRAKCFVCGRPIGHEPYVKATVMIKGRRAPAMIHAACADQSHGSAT